MDQNLNRSKKSQSREFGNSDKFRCTECGAIKGQRWIKDLKHMLHPCVLGAIYDMINQHGAIDASLAPSLVKRILGAAGTRLNELDRGLVRMRHLLEQPADGKNNPVAAIRQKYCPGEAQRLGMLPFCPDLSADSYQNQICGENGGAGVKMLCNCYGDHAECWARWGACGTDTGRT